MGNIIIDKDGQADMSFHGVPLYTIKRASLYLKKRGVWAELLKMAVNGVLYQFSETAQNGAVVFGENYGGWCFVAPDDRLPFASYSAMTMGQVLENMQAVMTADPIPAWDAFAVWLSDRLGDKGLSVDGVSKVTLRSVSCPDGQYDIEVSMPSFTAASCVEFLENLKTAFAPALEQPGSDYQGGSGGLAFDLYLWSVDDSGTESVALHMAFQFRE